MNDFIIKIIDFLPLGGIYLCIVLILTLLCLTMFVTHEWDESDKNAEKIVVTFLIFQFFIIIWPLSLCFAAVIYIFNIRKKIIKKNKELHKIKI